MAKKHFPQEAFALNQFKPCFVIPVYNHHLHLQVIFNHLLEYQIPIYVINDGSSKETELRLDEMKVLFPSVRFFDRIRNGGKGEAVKDGLWKAHLDGCTHALQIDADGQHDIKDIPAFLATATEHPDAMVLGCPCYGKDIPMGRLIGRQISKFWVWIETLSFAIQDPLVGYRVYPLVACVPLIREGVLGSHMEFDLQILVQLYWRGTPVANVSTRIQYPENGTSNFRILKDNIEISKAHTKLVFGMLRRFPRLLFLKGKVR